jgi:hypothetical protein
MLDVDIVFEQRIANGLACRRFNDSALRAEGGMRKYNDLRHLGFLAKM